MYYFEKAKDLNLLPANITIRKTDNHNEIAVISDVLARDVYFRVDSEFDDVVFSDNFIDLEP